MRDTLLGPWPSFVIALTAFGILSCSGDGPFRSVTREAPQLTESTTVAPEVLPIESCVSPESIPGLVWREPMTTGCIYDADLSQVIEFSRCVATERTWWRAPYLKDNVETDVSSFFSPERTVPCWSLFGPFVGQLVVVRDVHLSLANFGYRPREPERDRRDRPDLDPPSCAGYGQGWAGIAGWSALVPLLSPFGFPLRPCAEVWRLVESSNLPYWAPRPIARHTPPGSTSPVCEPQCPNWFWQQESLVLRVTNEGLFVVAAKEEFDVEYLTRFTTQPAEVALFPSLE